MLLYAAYLPTALYLLVPLAYWVFVHSFEGRACRELGGGLAGLRDLLSDSLPLRCASWCPYSRSFLLAIGANSSWVALLR